LALLLENEVVQVDLDTSNSKIVSPWERLEVVHPIPTEHHLLDIVNYVLGQVHLLIYGCSHGAPGLAREWLVGSEVTAALVGVLTGLGWLLEVHVQAVVHGVFVGHCNLGLVNVKSWWVDVIEVSLVPEQLREVKLVEGLRNILFRFFRVLFHLWLKLKYIFLLEGLVLLAVRTLLEGLFGISLDGLGLPLDLELFVLLL